jgi:hypothetical protein
VTETSSLVADDLRSIGENQRQSAAKSGWGEGHLWCICG